TVDATGKNVVINTYDLRGRKIASSDPDLGPWSYRYDGFGQVRQQIDAKSQTATLIYDLLGRLTQRVEADMTATWTYDGPNGNPTAPSIGKLVSASATGGAAGPNGFSRSLSYDSLSRPTQIQMIIDNAPYTFSGSYDVNGRLSQVSYPTGFK